MVLLFCIIRRESVCNSATQSQRYLDVLQEAEELGWLKNKKYDVVGISPSYKQKLSHQVINGLFIHIKPKGKVNLNKDQLRITKSQLNKFPFPRLINHYLEASAKS